MGDPHATSVIAVLTNDGYKVPTDRLFYFFIYSQVAKRIGHPPCIKRPKHCIFETFV